MKGRFKNKLFAMFMAAMMTVLVSIPVSADGVSKYDAIKGTTFTFDKYLVVKKGETNPAAEFTFDITVPAETKLETAAADELQVKPGPDGAVVGKAQFSAGEADNEDTAGVVKNSPFAEYTYEVKPVTVDFTKVSFAEPGVYRYYIEEDDSNSIFGYDTVFVRTVDVYIIDDGTGKLEVQGYVMYEGECTDNPKTESLDGAPEGTNGAEAGTKSDRFTNTYPTYTLTVTKTVAGNQGSRDKYFRFKITVTDNNIVDDADYPITGQDKFTVETEVNSATKYDLETIKAANKVSYVTGLQLKEGFYVYLQHGDEVKILGLPLNCTYSILEENEEYTKTAVITKESSATSETVTDGEVVSRKFDGSTTVAFTNTKTGVIPTGILLSIIPWIIAGGILLVGIIFFAVRSKKKYEEE